MAHPCLRTIQFCIYSYTLVAVVFTTYVYVLSPLVGLTRSLTSSGKLLGDISAQQNGGRRLSLLSESREVGIYSDRAVVPLDDRHWAEIWPVGYASSEMLYLDSPDAPRKGPVGLGYAVQEETLLSKAFSDAMHPTRIIPFYFKASGSVDSDDVTITTLVTNNRFRVFKQLVERYRGPISVTIHIPLPLHSTFASLKPDHPSRVALNNLHALYASSALFSQHVDVHLALSPFVSVLSSGNVPSLEGEGGRQFNVWRNAARLFARTEFVMMLDVDFAVCTDWRGAVRDALRAAALPPSPQPDGVNSVAIMKMLRDGAAALVVPVFEYVKQEAGVDQRTFPADKQALLRLAKATPPVIASFHASWAPGHNSTDYEKYYAIPPDSHTVYKVEHYQSAYEPYVITSKRVSWCDERFAGYGGNKAACLFEMYLSGVSFYVLSDHFLIHQSHKYEEEARREERKSNRKLYSDFKEEVCLRYLYRYYREGVLHTDRAANAREECKKIKNIAKTVSQVTFIYPVSYKAAAAQALTQLING
ncbi:glycosyl-transferase for dystroglycan-domain-containing protein [Lenzites betulinus]|nr:glycosyl-transferase for dystroglycan-domain-containing protein [Lenzites betulinus]